MFTTKNRGFTLVELIISLALMGLFFTMATYFYRDTRIYQARADRLANTIYDIIRNARNNMIIGRGVLSGSVLIVANERKINIGSNMIVGSFKSGNTYYTETGTQLVSPFFDKDSRYVITNIAVSSGGIVNGVMPAWDNNNISAAGIMFDTNAAIALTGASTINNIRTLKITAGYFGYEQSVVIDRITGTIELKGSNED